MTKVFINISKHKLSWKRIDCSKIHNSSLSLSSLKLYHKKHLGSISSTCLCAAFMRPDPKIAKKLLEFTVFFALLGSMRVKAACKLVDEIDP